eukprot:TRINITY_DN17354_c0_g1_i1.p1 TRINITY_DN17354_c0_g1~~TRINITY_DN17354_c0_g1_i1.p1  ORF type:complete len:109 (+),score=25.34 TRINITY_DN17354_c0_g1_i1:22-348(+)
MRVIVLLSAATLVVGMGSEYDENLENFYRDGVEQKTSSTEQGYVDYYKAVRDLQLQGRYVPQLPAEGEEDPQEPKSKRVFGQSSKYRNNRRYGFWISAINKAGNVKRS